MINDDVRGMATHLLDAASCGVVLPAGCGKTQLVAGTAAVAAARNQRLLVLTHTHAGVEAIRNRMRQLNVPGNAVQVSTIDHWTHRLAMAFPKLAGYVVTPDVFWPDVHRAAARLLENPHIRDMVGSTYDFAVIDEYQDCTKCQHAVVMAVAQLMRIVILGDPFQAIYNFGGNQLIEWSTDVGHLQLVDIPVRPWRWASANAALGDFLLDVRDSLAAGQPIDLRGKVSVVAWCEDTQANRRSVCWQALRNSGTTVILERFPAQCAKVARMLSGHFGVMEEVEGTYLMEPAKIVDDGVGHKAAAALLHFARGCFSGLPSALSKKETEIGTGQFPRYKRTTAFAALLEALEAVSHEPTPHHVLRALVEVEKLDGTLIRKEAWRDMIRAARRWAEGNAPTLPDAVRVVRDHARMYGRKQDRRSVSRVVLVKGQEFDECIVLGADALNARELYVAMTRPRHRLAVVSRSPVLTPKE
ncbi:MAG: AAA family ATPase [Actinomycetota bacterium]|nr:AAA family ATPase [Actinomycetota bacterium]